MFFLPAVFGSQLETLSANKIPPRVKGCDE